MTRNSNFAGRRAALIDQCAQQREDAAFELTTLLHPISRGGMRLKLPLTIAGAVLGLIASRPGRTMPLITAGLTLWKLARGLLSAMRRA